MPARPLLAALLGAALAGPGLAQDASAGLRATAQRGLEVLHAIHQRNGTQESPMRRCRAYMDEAASAEKLGARDAAARNWDRAARGCTSEAIVACRAYKAVAPGEQCNRVSR
jgi:hypothetical protein